MDSQVKNVILLMAITLALMSSSFVHAAKTSTASVVTTACGIHEISCSKDLSNIVFRANGEDIKIEPLSGYQFTLEQNNVTNVWVKCGAYKSGDGPGYGHRFLVDDSELCNPTPPGMCTIDADCTSGRCGEGGFCTVAVGGRVFFDDDRDGVFSLGDEPAIAGLYVQVLAPIGWVRLGFEVTDQDGFYNFTSLNFDFSYRIEVITPPNEPAYVFTSPNVGSDDTIDSDVDQFGISDPVNLDPDEVDENTWVGVLRNLP